jgi:hypothetical protein
MDEQRDREHTENERTDGEVHMRHLVAKIGITTRADIVMNAALCGLQGDIQPGPSNPADLVCTCRDARLSPMHAET